MQEFGEPCFGLTNPQIRNNDPNDVDFAQSLRIRDWTGNPTSAPFRWNTTGGVTAGEFGHGGFDALNPLSAAMGASGSYMVRDGDTLAGIAAAQWGDASLWYLAATRCMPGSGRKISAFAISMVIFPPTTVCSTVEVQIPARRGE